MTVVTLLIAMGRVCCTVEWQLTEGSTKVALQARP
jgi:hypothetical protein